ncbi:hypothetical protein ACHAXN_001073, partial [Cyclotella atomus]
MLTSKAVRKHFPESEETTKGHMRRVKSGVRSTKAQVEEPEEIQLAEAELAELRRKHRDIYVTVKEHSEMIHTDQTGRFPVVSDAGHKYIMTLVDIDSNYIAMEPMRSREAAELIKVYETIMARLKGAGIQPKKQILDNEAPRAYLEAIEAQGLEWELVPPTNHRRCIAERGIQTAKGHIIANIIGCDEAFPARQWHKLLPQMEMTLNMLRAANVRPTVSAHTYVYGLHDYNKIPLGPLGCKIQCFVDPDNRRTFGAHATNAFYIRTSPNHYRCQEVFVADTRATRITDTYVFHHKRITNPSVTKADVIVAAASELTTAIKNNFKEDVTKLNLNELERL